MIVPGVERTEIADRYLTAKRIIMNSVLYGPFVGTEHEVNLMKTVSRPEFERLDVVEMRPDFEYFWEMMALLRPGRTKEEVLEEVAISNHLVSQFKALEPNKVFIYPLRRFVPLPIVIVDDDIYFGHFSHYDVATALGFWMKTSADVGKLSAWYEAGEVPKDATPHDVAAYRLVYECIWAIDEKNNVEEP